LRAIAADPDAAAQALAPHLEGPLPGPTQIALVDHAKAWLRNTLALLRGGAARPVAETFLASHEAHEAPIPLDPIAALLADGGDGAEGELAFRLAQAGGDALRRADAECLFAAAALKMVAQELLRQAARLDPDEVARTLGPLVPQLPREDLRKVATLAVTLAKTLRGERVRHEKVLRDLGLERYTRLVDNLRLAKPRDAPALAAELLVTVVMDLQGLQQSRRTQGEPLAAPGPVTEGGPAAPSAPLDILARLAIWGDAPLPGAETHAVVDAASHPSPEAYDEEVGPNKPPILIRRLSMAECLDIERRLDAYYRCEEGAEFPSTDEMVSRYLTRAGYNNDSFTRLRHSEDFDREYQRIARGIEVDRDMDDMMRATEKGRALLLGRRDRCRAEE
jgi:hypothetical protein